MKTLITTLFFAGLTTAAFSQDRLFAYTYQSNVLNKGDFDLEYISTLATGKVGPYSPYVYGQYLKQRLEFEAGLGRKVQTAFYFNSKLTNYADTSSTGMSQKFKVNFSNEWKWKLSDPVANSMGSALYGELEFGGNNIEFEGKIILDKRWKNDLFAFNMVGKYEVEKEIERDSGVTKAEWEHSYPVEFYLGFMHLFNPKPFGIGLELKNNNNISRNDGWVNSILFAGPAFHASSGKFFVNISFLPQIINLYKTAKVPGNRDYKNYEALEVRLLMGYGF